MVHVNNKTQLSLFNTFVTIITSDSTLSGKFNKGNILQYEPLSLKHQSLPFIYIQLPSTDSTTETLGTANKLLTRNFNISMYMFNQYTAKDNVLNYANSIVTAFETDSTAQSSGYYDIKCNLVDSRTEEKDNQTIITTEFYVTCTGNVNYT